MDPQQRLLLHSAVEALENAGYVPDSTSSFQKKSFGVYIGVATNDYVDNLRDDIDVYYSPGKLPPIVLSKDLGELNTIYRNSQGFLERSYLICI